jgi:hypothetical protein
MYGENKNWRYILGFAAVIVLLFIIIFMIVRGGGDNKSEVPETKRDLVSYASEENFRVTQTVISPITAAQNHDQIQITVNNSSANIDLIKGYEGNVIANRSYPMSVESFREFLSALDKANYTRGNTDEKLRDDRGYCSTGQRFVYEIYQGANSLQRFWTTSCGGTKTFRGNANLVNTLFRAQIPDYGQITNDAADQNGFFGL